MKKSQASTTSWDLANAIATVMFLAGVGLIGYGLWLFLPWVSYVVVGAILLVVSIASTIIRTKPAGGYVNAE